MNTIYKIYLVIIVAIICVFPIQASAQKIIWHAGQITFWNNTLLEGNISYNWLAEMVLMRQPDGRISTFSAEQVYSFGWFDYSQHKYRSFTSLQNKIAKGQTNQVFFEVCMDGSLTVVRRLKRPHGLWKRAFGHPSNFTDRPTIAKEPDHFDYFVHDAGRLVSLDRFYTDIYTPIMIIYDQELTRYVQRHNLNDRTLLARLVLIDQYNILVQHDTRTASARQYGTAPN